MAAPRLHVGLKESQDAPPSKFGAEVWTKIKWGLVAQEGDAGPLFDPAKPTQLLVPEDGLYEVDACPSLYATGPGAYIFYRVTFNGAFAHPLPYCCHSYDNFYDQGRLYTQRRCKKGDYFEIELCHYADKPAPLMAGTGFTFAYLRQLDKDAAPTPGPTPGPTPPPVPMLTPPPGVPHPPA